MNALQQIPKPFLIAFEEDDEVFTEPAHDSTYYDPQPLLVGDAEPITPYPEAKIRSSSPC